MRNCDIQTQITRDSSETTRIERIPRPDGTEQVNLDNSVFRNFKRLQHANILKCVSNDTRYWVAKDLIEDKEDYKRTVDVIIREFRTLGELHHMLSAKYDAFPQLKLKHMPEILSSGLGVFHDTEKCKSISQSVLSIYEEYRSDVQKSDYTLSRVLMIELLLVYIKYEIEQGNATNFADTLCRWTREHFQPYVNQNAKVEETLTMFRKELVWTNEVNLVFYLNTEGLIRVFNEYMHPSHGFDFRVA